MTNMNTKLPREILDLIFSYLKPSALKECQHVCKAWRKQAELMLFNEIVINEHVFSKYPKMLRPLDVLGYLVQYIHFDLPYGTKQIKVDVICEIFKRCPNVKHITSNEETPEIPLCFILVMGQNSVPLKLESIPVLCNFSVYFEAILYFRKSLTTLHTGVSMLFKTNNMASITKSSVIFPQLKNLKVCGIIQSMEIWQNILLFHDHLQDLSFKLETTQFDIIPPIITFPSLKSLTITANINPSFSFTSFIQLLRSTINLECLTITFIDSMGTIKTKTDDLNDLARTMIQLHNLREVKISSGSFESRRDPRYHQFDNIYTNFFVKWILMSNPEWATDVRFLVNKPESKKFLNLRVHKLLTYSMSRKNRKHCVDIFSLVKTDGENEVYSYLKDLAPLTHSLHFGFHRRFSIQGKYHADFILPLLQRAVNLKELAIMGGKYEKPLIHYRCAPSVQRLCLKNVEFPAAFSIKQLCDYFPNLEMLSLQFSVEYNHIIDPKLVYIPSARLKKVCIDIIDKKEPHLYDITSFQYNTRPLRFNVSLRTKEKSIYFMYYHHDSNPRLEILNEWKPGRSKESDILDMSMEFYSIEEFLFTYDGKMKYSWSA